MCPSTQVVGKEEEANDHSKGPCKRPVFSFWVIGLIFGKMCSAWVGMGVSFHTLINIPYSQRPLYAYTTNVPTQHVFPSGDFLPSSLTHFISKQWQHL